MKHLVSAIVALVVLVSCAPMPATQRSVLNPATGPNTGFPCGYRGVTCGNGWCCSEGQTCCGVPYSGCDHEVGKCNDVASANDFVGSSQSTMVDGWKAN